MRKIFETVETMFTAARYSLSFCLRNAKRDTLWRLLTAVGSTLLLYLIIQATGSVVNTVQVLIQKGGLHTFSDLLNSELKTPLLFFAGVLIFGVIIGRLHWYFRGRWNMTLRYANQRELNEHRASLDIARFRSKEYDDLSKRIQELPSGFQTRIWFSEEILNIFTTLISFFLFGASLVFFSPVYAVVLIVSAIPMMLFEFRFVNVWWKLFQELVPHHKRRAVLEKAYQDVPTFVQAKMFNQMHGLKKEIDLNIDTVLSLFNAVRKKAMEFEIITHFIAMLGLGGVIVHASWTTVVTMGEIGTLTVVIAASRTFQSNIEAIVALVAEQWNSAKGVILIEKEFMGLLPVLETKNPITPTFSGAPKIRFENVSFAYPDTEALVLKNVSFEIEPGSKVAIVGKSGHGKSTIQSLLMRNYDPTEGTIFADTVDLRSIKPNVWNTVTSSLTQEYSVLERTIREEIASSRLTDAVQDDVVHASSVFANFDEVVDSDPQGYESQIGVQFGGRDFSGGEKQRLALARVHYRNTPILIFDEPDARLDPESAQKVIENIFALQGVTVIMITHHVSRAMLCDKVLVIKKGEVVEQGNPNELLQKNGVFTSLYEKDKKRLS